MRWLLAAFLTLLAAGTAFAYTSPGAPTGYVNDFAHALSPETKRSLDTELSQFEKDTSNEIAVAIVPDMGGDYIENYAVKLFEEWGVGKKDRDNGVLLVVAMQEHKLRIEVGYGLEGALPDSLAQRILDDEMTPRLRAGDTDGAVTAAVHAIESATTGEYTPTEPKANPLSWIWDNIEWLFFGVIVGFQWLAAILARSKSWWAGGIVGALAGVGLGWLIAFPLLVTSLIALLLTALGLLFDYAVSNAYRYHSGRGSIPPWWAGGGSVGGSSGGSFGGFGGGSSGGGGASGGW